MRGNDESGATQVPITFSYDLDGAEIIHRNRLQSMLERFRWKRTGGSTYRYPVPGAKAHEEDWINYVVPALMCFRNYVIKHSLKITRYDLTGMISIARDASTVNVPLSTNGIEYAQPTNAQFGKKNLKTWLDESVDLIPY